MNKLLLFLQNAAQGTDIAWLWNEYGWLLFAAAFALGGLLIIAWISVVAILGTYAERRVAGFIQGRLGPNRVGPWGILQPVADGIKLLSKEDIVPHPAAKFYYTLAPLLVFIGAFIPFAALPFSDKLVISNMTVAIYYILAFEALEVVGILMAGWAPGSKWSLYGGMRLAAQMLSYEVPMGVCLLIIVMLTGSLNFHHIVSWQSHHWIFGWAIFRSPAAFIAFFIYFIGGLASTKRAPFDLPEAESELVAGYHTEYTGMRFAMFFMAEYAAMYIICAVASILFLGGWYGPLPNITIPDGTNIASAFMQTASSSPHIFAALFDFMGSQLGLRLVGHECIAITNLTIKSFGLYFVMLWVRWTLPRIRIDQVMYMCLKVLLPFSLVCLFIAAAQVALIG